MVAVQTFTVSSRAVPAVQSFSFDDDRSFDNDPLAWVDSKPIEPVGDLPVLLGTAVDQPIWSELQPRVESSSTGRRQLLQIIETRYRLLIHMLSSPDDRRSVERARLDALRAFAETRYRKAEALCWQVLESAPGEIPARAFLAEALIAQRRWLDAQDVLLGLRTVRSVPEALDFAAALRQGFETGLFQRLGPFPTD